MAVHRVVVVVGVGVAALLSMLAGAGAQNVSVVRLHVVCPKAGVQRAARGAGLQRRRVHPGVCAARRRGRVAGPRVAAGGGRRAHAASARHCQAAHRRGDVAAAVRVGRAGAAPAGAHAVPRRRGTSRRLRG